MMRIGVVSSLRTEPWGGSEELWFAMCQSALGEGIAVSILLPVPEVPHPKWQMLRRSGADLFCLPHASSVSARISKHAARMSYRLGKRLQQNAMLDAFHATKPDVLLVNECVSVPSHETIDSVEHGRRTVPYVILSHANYGEVPEDSVRQRAREFYANAKRCLFVSCSNRNATQRQLLQILPHTSIVRNPVNLSDLSAVGWPGQETPSFACIGRLQASAKGQDIMLQALGSKEWMKRDWTLSIYGSGRDEVYLREMSAFYGIGERVRFEGVVHDVRSIWKKHHMLLLPSRAEGLPLVLVEAMICGRPAVATAVAGHPEWVESEKNGFLARSADAADFADALNCAWRKRSEWQAMGEIARRDALDRYDPNSGMTLLSILQKAAAKPIYAQAAG